MFKRGDFVKVRKSKFLEVGTFVEVIDVLAEGVYLCGTVNNQNYIVVGKNLEKANG
jgi:hypothetical protein